MFICSDGFNHVLPISRHDRVRAPAWRQMVQNLGKGGNLRLLFKYITSQKTIFMKVIRKDGPLEEIKEVVWLHQPP